MIVTPESIKASSGWRSGAAEAVAKVGRPLDGGRFELTPEQSREIRLAYFIQAEDRDRPWTGLGDVIASATKAIGIKPCPKCQQRQAVLNKAFPFQKG